MCLNKTPESDCFAQWLLQVGAGEDIDGTGNITLPPHMQCGNKVDDLIKSIYPNIEDGNKPDQYFLERTILSCKNDDVDDLNEAILAKFLGQERILKSADSVTVEVGVDGSFDPYPVEYLNSIKASGLPLAHLSLKEGCPLMLLCNLDPANGLCNETCMVLLRIQPHVLKCHILDGKHAGQTVFIQGSP